MRRTRASASLLLALGTTLLTACEITKPPFPVAGGSGIEGSGLVYERPRSMLDHLLTRPEPQISVVELAGDAHATGPLKAGEQFSSNAAFELRSGTARLRLPGEVIIAVTGPARIQFAQVDGQVSAMLEAGQIESSAAGRVVTSRIAALACDSGFRAARSNTTTRFDCGGGTVTWNAGDTAHSLSGASTWIIDETERRVTGR